MAISYVGQATGITSATLPTHQAGDLILAFAYRDGATQAPTVPAGWTTINSGSGGGGTSNSSALAYRVATAPGTASGTWTNATGVIFQVYRGANVATPIGVDNTATGSTATVTYPALTGLTSGSWVAAFAGHRSVNTNLEIAPGSMVNRSNYVDSVNELAGHDTNGAVSSWSSTNVSIGGTASNWITRVVEIESTQDFDLTETYTGSASVNAVMTYTFQVASSASGSSAISAPLDYFLNTGIRVTMDGNRRVTESGADVRVLQSGSGFNGVLNDVTLGLSGAGTFYSIASLYLNAKATLLGSLSQLSASTLSTTCIALLNSSGSVSATPSISRNVSSTLTGAGTINGTMFYVHSGSVSLSSGGTMSSQSAILKNASGSFSGSGSFAAIASLTRNSSLTLSGSGSIQVIARTTLKGVSSLSASGSLNGLAQSFTNIAVSLNATSDFGISPRIIREALILQGSTSTISGTLISAQALNASLYSYGYLNGSEDMILSASVIGSTPRRLTESGDTRITETGDFRITNVTDNVIESAMTGSMSLTPYNGALYGHRNGSYKPVVPYVKYNGSWVVPTVYVKHEGIWKRVY